MKFNRVVLLFFLAGTGVLFAAGNGYKLFQQGLAKERAEADLRGAIQIYEKVVQESASDRKLAAQALYRIGECRRALGDAEARKAYERILRDYPEQKEVAAEARTRLAALLQPPASDGALTARQVLDDMWVDAVSGDGRFLSFTDWSTGGDLAVRDLRTGTDRRLTKRGNHGYATESVISPDGRQVAFLWLETAEAHKPNATPFHLRIVPFDGSSPPRTVYRGTGYIDVRGWSPGGESLLVTRALDDKTWQLAMISVQDGSVRQLKSLRWAKIGASISPDGRYIAYDTPVGDESARDIFVLAADGSRESAAVEHPANDHSTVWAPDGSRILFVSNRTGTPSLWSVPVDDGKPTGPAELLKSDTGPLVPLGMTNSGTLYYAISARSRRNIHIAKLDAEGTVSKAPATITNRYFNSNWGASFSPDGGYLAFYSKRPETTLVIRNLESGNERVVPVKLPVGGPFFIGPAWLPDGRSVLVMARENQRPGTYYYRVDVATGNAEELGRGPDYGGDYSPDGKSVFHRKNNSTKLVRFDLITGQEHIVRTVSPPDEQLSNPAISPDGKWLAHVYDGERRSLEVMDSGGGEPRTIFTDASIQRYNSMEWTPDKRYLLFVKEGESDESLLWRVPVGGGQAEYLGVSTNGGIKGPQMHPDGQRIVYSTVEDGADEVWALENFLPALSAKK